jgi:hypothetical protein
MFTPEKASAMRTAALLTVAACAARGLPFTGALVIDPTNQDPAQRNLNLQVWEIFRGFYLGLNAAVADDTDWPSPPSATKALPSPIAAAVQLPAVAQAIAGNAALSPLLTALTGLGVKLVTQAVAQVPAPGVPAAAPATTAS